MKEYGDKEEKPEQGFSAVRLVIQGGEGGREEDKEQADERRSPCYTARWGSVVAARRKRNRRGRDVGRKRRRNRIKRMSGVRFVIQ